MSSGVTRRRSAVPAHVSSAGNVFIDLGFEPAEATVMQMRAVLAIEIEKRILTKRWSPQEAAKQLRISERRLRKLVSNTGGGTSLDVLLTLAGRAGLRPELRIASSAARGAAKRPGDQQ